MCTHTYLDQFDVHDFVCRTYVRISLTLLSHSLSLTLSHSLTLTHSLSQSPVFPSTAGEKGTAYTLVTAKDVSFAGDLVRSLVCHHCCPHIHCTAVHIVITLFCTSLSPSFMFVFTSPSLFLSPLFSFPPSHDRQEAADQEVPDSLLSLAMQVHTRTHTHTHTHTRTHTHTYAHTTFHVAPCRAHGSESLATNSQRGEEGKGEASSPDSVLDWA